MGKHRKLFEKLEKQRKDTFAKVLPLSHEQQTQTPADGGWSIIQVLDHLRQSEELSAEYMRKKLIDPSQLKSVGIWTSIKCLILYANLMSNRKFKAPSMIANPTSSLDLAGLKASYDRVRQETLDILEKTPNEHLKKAVNRHPVIGRINAAQGLRMHYWHSYHHQRQIDRILEEVKGK